MPKSDLLLARLGKLYPQLIDLSLDRIRGLLTKLGNPQDRLPPVIHVAGTNGKGSTIAFLAAILQAAGLRVHVYTSPHLVSFHERIQVPDENGVTRPISEQRLVALLEEIERTNADDPMTFFEATTAAAFKIFSDIPADVVLLEVGLGGRFDATNVIEHPRLTIITPISLDHTDKLGATVALIAAEKAGILKSGVTCVVAPQDGAILDVIEAHAEAVKANVFAAGRDFDAYEQAGRMVFQTTDMLLDLPVPGLIGRHQILNAGVAVAATMQLPELNLGLDAIERGLQVAVWPGRMQRLKSEAILDAAGPAAEVWLDGGHNPAGGMAIARTLADLDDRAPKPITLIVGALANKDIAAFLAPFKGLARRLIAVPLGQHSGPSHDPASIASTATALGIEASTSADVLSALRSIRENPSVACRIMICGSLYLAGEVLSIETTSPQS